MELLQDRLDKSQHEYYTISLKLIYKYINAV